MCLGHINLLLYLLSICLLLQKSMLIFGRDVSPENPRAKELDCSVALLGGNGNFEW